MQRRMLCMTPLHNMSALRRGGRIPRALGLEGALIKLMPRWSAKVDLPGRGDQPGTTACRSPNQGARADPHWTAKRTNDCARCGAGRGATADPIGLSVAAGA